MEYILKFINSYPYLVLFVGSTIDHSGVPFFTILAGILFATSSVDFLPAMLAIMFAFALNDLIFILLGAFYFKKRIEKNKGNHFKTIDIVILEKGLNLYKKSKNSFYYFSKIIPGVGKYSPIFTGIFDTNLKLSFLKYVLGSFIYFILFFIPSMFIGEQLKQTSKIFGLFLLIIFIVIYKIFEFLAKEKMKRQKASQQG